MKINGALFHFVYVLFCWLIDYLVHKMALGEIYIMDFFQQLVNTHSVSRLTVDDLF